MSGQPIFMLTITIAAVAVVILLYFYSRAGRATGTTCSSWCSAEGFSGTSGQPGEPQIVQLGGDSWEDSLPAPYPSPFVGASLARLELGEISLLDNVLSRDRKSKSVGTSWYGLDEETLELLAKAPVSEGTSLDDPCAIAAANIYSWSAQEIGRPAGVFAEPGASTGNSLGFSFGTQARCLGQAARPSCLRGNSGSFESTNCLEMAGPGPQSAGPKASPASGPGGSAFLRRITTSESSREERKNNNPPASNHPSPSSEKMVVRGEYYDDLPGAWGAWSLPGYSPQAGTNMITPDLVGLPELPQKCAYVTAGGMRILEECDQYTMNRPGDYNM